MQGSDCTAIQATLQEQDYHKDTATYLLGLPTFRRNLEICWDYKGTPDYRNQFLWGKWLLWRSMALYPAEVFANQIKPCPPQTLSTKLPEFDHLELTAFYLWQRALCKSRKPVFYG